MSERRRGTASKRPASTEEVDCWSHAAASLQILSNLSLAATKEDRIGKVNRLFLAWPEDDELPTGGIEEVNDLHKKLKNGLAEIRADAEREIKALDDAIERIGVLIALRKASESIPPGPEKRAKRPRGPSPTGPPAASTPILPSAARSSSIPKNSRDSVGPQPSIPFSRDPKARREALSKQLPLQSGRMVAFHQHPKNNGNDPNGNPESQDETSWILAKVTKCIGQDKNRYVVEDVDQDSAVDGKAMTWQTTLRNIIPLPDMNVPFNNPAHLNAYQEFPPGSTVMALYPDTSCFYRAQVVASPKDLNGGGRGSAATKSKLGKAYKLKFEDDNDQEHTVLAQWVVEYPGL